MSPRVPSSWFAKYPGGRDTCRVVYPGASHLTRGPTNSTPASTVLGTAHTVTCFIGQLRRRLLPIILTLLHHPKPYYSRRSGSLRGTDRPGRCIKRAFLGWLMLPPMLYCYPDTSNTNTCPRSTTRRSGGGIFTHGKVTGGPQQRAVDLTDQRSG